MQAKLDNSLEANRKAMDNMYLGEVIKLPEKIDHVQMLTSITKLRFKPVIESSSFCFPRGFKNVICRVN